MMRYQVAFEGRAGRRAGQFDADLLQVGLEEVVNELLARRAQDATVSWTLAKGRIEISLTVEAPGFEEALHAGEALIAQALQAAGFDAAWSVEWSSVRTSRVGRPKAELVQA